MESLDYLKKLISLKSYSLTENEEITNYLKKEFGKIAEEILVIKSDYCDKCNLLVGLNTKLKNAKDAVILSGHIDTVVANEIEYKTNPYEGAIVGDKIYGLGSIDMKSFFASILANAGNLKKLSCPIVIAITCDEETSFCGVEKITDTMKSYNIQPKFTIVGEPTSSKICSESKSCSEYKIDVLGKSCHSSVPDNGINANYILAELVLFIKKICGKFKNTTCTCNVISGGEKVNIISDKATLKFDVRSLSSKNSDKILSLLNKKISKLKKKYSGAEIKLSQEFNILPLENKNPKLIKNICNSLNLCENNFTGGCEAGYYQNLGGDAIIFGVGDLNLAHKPNEFAEISELNVYYDKLESLINFVVKKN